MNKTKYLLISVLFAVSLSALFTYVNAVKPPPPPEYATVEQVQQWLSDLETDLTAYIDYQAYVLQTNIDLLTTDVSELNNRVSDLEYRVTQLEYIVSGTGP